MKKISKKCYSTFVNETKSEDGVPEGCKVVLSRQLKNDRNANENAGVFLLQYKIDKINNKFAWHDLDDNIWDLGEVVVILDMLKRKFADSCSIYIQNNTVKVTLESYKNSSIRLVVQEGPECVIPIKDLECSLEKMKEIEAWFQAHID